MANNEKQDKLKDVWSIWECNFIYIKNCYALQKEYHYGLYLFNKKTHTLNNFQFSIFYLII